MEIKKKWPYNHISCATWYENTEAEQNGFEFEDNIYKSILWNWNYVLILISLRSVPRGANDNKSALVQKMTRDHLGNKQSSEPMLTSLTMPYGVTRPQCMYIYI